MTKDNIELIIERLPANFYVKFVEVEGALHIRKWAHRPFDGAQVYVCLGNGSPPDPMDGDEHYPVEMMPQALRFVAEHLFVECERHVIEDCARIVTDAANLIEALTKPSAERVEAVLEALEPFDDALGEDTEGYDDDTTVVVNWLAHTAWMKLSDFRKVRSAIASIADGRDQ